MENYRTWLSTKDPNEQFKFTDTEDCQFAQFLKWLGHPFVSVGVAHWSSNIFVYPNAERKDDDRIEYEFPEWAQTLEAQMFKIKQESLDPIPYTFGLLTQALKRLA